MGMNGRCAIPLERSRKSAEIAENGLSAENNKKAGKTRPLPVTQPTVSEIPWSTGRATKSSGAKVVGRALARALVLDDFVLDLLAFGQLAHARTFDGRDMNENVGRTFVRLDEAEALGGVKPFYCASGHDEPFHSV